MILITGASSGIGEACARVLAQKKRDLILVARRKEKLDQIAKELQTQHGIKVLTFKLDVSRREEIEAFARENATTLSKTTALINNAGLAKGLETIQDADPGNWDVMIDTNLKGLLNITRAIVPHFIAKKDGHIVNIGSVAGHYVYPKGNVYCATKHAVRAINEGLRLDLNGTGVRVSEVSPGMVETEFSFVRLGDQKKADAVYAGMTPLTPLDIAETVVWCLDRPKHVNIQEVVVYPTDQASPTVLTRIS